MRRLINWIYISRFVLGVEASCQDYSILHLDTASVPDNEMMLVCIYYLHPGVLKPAIFGSLPWAYVMYNSDSKMLETLLRHIVLCRTTFETLTYSHPCS